MITDSEHSRRYEALINMYESAPINALFDPGMRLSSGRAEISMELREDYYHAGGSAHGAIFFKMLDDAACFAAYTLEDSFFLVTSGFTTYLTRPLLAGSTRAVGTVIDRTGRQYLAESVLYDADGTEVARGSGIFVRTRQSISSVAGFTDQSASTAVN